MARWTGCAVHLDAPDADAFSGRMKLHFLLELDGTGQQSACDHGSEAMHRESAVDREPEVLGGIFFGHGGGDFGDLGAKLAQAGAGHRADRDNRGGFEKRTAHEFVHFQAHQLEQFAIHQVGFGEHYDAVADAQQHTDVEMFARLWLNRFISSNDEKDQIDADYASQHVFDEPFMARYVYKTEAQVAGKLQVREAEVYRNAALLFFLEAVCVYPC